MPFDEAQLDMTDGTTYTVSTGVARWRGPPLVDFEVDLAAPVVAVDGNALPGGRPFSSSNCRPSGSNARVADLKFDTLIGNVDDWHEVFDECRTLKLWMKFAPPHASRQLTVKIRCLTHPKVPHASLAKFKQQATEALANVWAFIKRVATFPIRIFRTGASDRQLNRY
jgi:hypothetical protein